MKRGLAVFLLAAIGAAGCRFGGDKKESLVAMSTRPQETRVAKESRTLSRLALLQGALAAYTKINHKPPKNLSDLVPKYIASIPFVEGLTKHKPSKKVRRYPARTLLDGSINKRELRDRGGWGYAPSDPPKVFVDCHHTSSRGLPWYSERGML